MAAIRVIRDLSRLLDVDPSAMKDGSTLVYNEAEEKHEYEPQTGGPTSLLDLTDVTGTPGVSGNSPVDDGTGNFPLTPSVTQKDLDAILVEVVWHKVAELADPWQPSNPTAVLTPDGVTFGPYADAAASGGSLRYLGLNGQPFSAVRNIAFNMRYRDDSGTVESAPYARVYMQDTDGVQHDAIYTPGTQDFPSEGPGIFQEYVATSGTWRYDSDDGSNSEFGNGAPLADVQAKYGDQLIIKLTITLGFTAGVNLRGLLRWWQINGDHLAFGSA